jgi:hypothetical protein
MQLGAFPHAYLHIPDPVNPMASEVRKVELNLAGFPVGSHVYIGPQRFEVSQVWLSLDDDDGEDGIHLRLGPI